MEHIESLFLLAKGNEMLIFIFAILATFIESFIPALPLIGIVIMNAALLGFFKGVLASAIGSILGTILLFLLASKFSNLKFLDRFKNGNTDKITKWARQQNYILLFLCYSCPFIPDCLITICSGSSGKSIKSFVPAMILGKLTMFSIAGYIGNDIQGLIIHPERIVVVLIMIIISFFIGKNVNLNMNSGTIDKNVA